MGAGFHRAGCCCGEEFCLGCEQSEPTATVTITGAGEGACEEWCDVYEGNYTFDASHHDTSGNEYYCWWGLEHPTIASVGINIIYCHGSGLWYAKLYQIGTIYGGTEDDPCDGITSDDWKEVDIECTGGELVGSFDLDGLGSCEGCTASVTLT